MARRAGAVDRGAVVALALAVPLALGAVIAWAPLKDMFPPPEQPEPYTGPRPKSKGPTPKKGKDAPKGPSPIADPGASVEMAPPPKSAEHGRALRGCRLLAEAVEVYAASALNPGTSDVERLPTDLKDLAEPPFGGPSILANGTAALTDPWGQPYTAQLDLPKDGKPRLLVATTAPDGTRITQFGIGPGADPKD